MKLIYLLKTLANYNAVDMMYEFWLSAPMLLANSFPTLALSTSSAPSLIALLSASHFFDAELAFTGERSFCCNYALYVSHAR